MVRALVLCAVVGIGMVSTAAAEPNRDAVHDGRRRVWQGAERERVISPVAWSKRRDAVAFVTRSRSGTVALVVVLVGGAADGHTMRWPIPSTAQRDLSRPRATWLSATRVAFAPDAVRPTVVASWTVR